MGVTAGPRPEEMDDLGVPEHPGSHEEFVADPYAHYRLLRTAGGSVQRAHSGGRLLVLGHRECAAALRDRRLRHPLERVNVGGDQFRRMVHPMFTPAAVAARRRRIDDEVARLLAGAPRGPAAFEVVEGLARPLTLAVIGDLLGLPEADRHRLAAAPSVLSGAIDPDRIDPAALELAGLFGELFEARRAEPADDLVSHMIRYVGGDHRPWAESLARGCHVLLRAGYDATAHAVGNLVLALGRHPGGRKFLGGHPDRIPAAVQEVLRYDPPVQIVGRVAAEALDIGGARVAAGETVLLVLAAANRDPEWLPAPDVLDVGRSEAELAGQLAFGGGGHFCLGAALARAQAAAVMSALCRGPVQLAGTSASAPVYRPGFPIRGLAELHVVLR
ncbi:cytochrome P450 [Spirillospora sp. NPDC048911]|uniref:cytochrome P450 n=1 Tax=Spirillospora sp. NPDC048911 TaxID=3364527 RepID=UPI003712ED72